MPRRTRSVVPLLLGVVLGARAGAQPSAAPMPVLRGTAFDSVRHRPLGEAFVTLDGARSTTADAAGRFRFDGVAPGEHVVAVQHAALDSLGLTGVTARATTDGHDADVRVATPSFAALWRAACGERTPPKDSGFVYGRVVDAFSAAAVAGATVGLVWLDLHVDKERAINMQQFAGAVLTSHSGAYAICGVPVGVALRMQVSADSGETSVIDLAPTASPVQRHDFAVPHGGTTAAPRGTVVGRVTDASGAPLADVRIAVADMPEARTDAAGRFVVRDVLAGSQQVEAMAVGMSPVAEIVTVLPGDSVTFVATMQKVATLDAMRIVASSRGRRLLREIEERAHSGLGYLRDSTQIMRGALVTTTFDRFPGTMVRRAARGSGFTVMMKDPKHQWCEARVLVDGHDGDAYRLEDLLPQDVAFVEAFPHGAFVPAELTSVQREARCGVVAVWTKRALR